MTDEQIKPPPPDIRTSSKPLTRRSFLKIAALTTTAATLAACAPTSLTVSPDSHEPESPDQKALAEAERRLPIGREVFYFPKATFIGKKGVRVRSLATDDPGKNPVIVSGMKGIERPIYSFPTLLIRGDSSDFDNRRGEQDWWAVVRYDGQVSFIAYSIDTEEFTDVKDGEKNPIDINREENRQTGTIAGYEVRDGKVEGIRINISKPQEGNVSSQWELVEAKLKEVRSDR